MVLIKLSFINRVKTLLDVKSWILYFNTNAINQFENINLGHHEKIFIPFGNRLCSRSFL